MSPEVTVYISSNKDAKHFLAITGEWVNVSDCLTRYYELSSDAVHTLITKGAYSNPKTKLHFSI